MISYYVKQGLLQASAHPSRKRSMYFTKEDLDGVKTLGRNGRQVNTARGDVDLALHLAQANTATVNELLRYLGMDRIMLSEDPEDIISTGTFITRACAELVSVTEEEELRWARQFSTITPGYLRLARTYLKQTQPWELYTEFLTMMVNNHHQGSLLRAQLVNAIVAVRQAAYLLVAGGRTEATRKMERTERPFLSRVREHLIILDRRGRAKTRTPAPDWDVPESEQ